MCTCVYECWCPQRSEEGIGSSGAQVIGSCESPDMNAGN